MAGITLEVTEALSQEVQSYIEKGGVVTEIPINQGNSQKIVEISRVLFYPAQHKFYAKNTGISYNRIRELGKDIKMITDQEIDQIWTFISSRKSTK